jgi:hypothetical protein
MPTNNAAIKATFKSAHHSTVKTAIFISHLPTFVTTINKANSITDAATVYATNKTANKAAKL